MEHYKLELLLEAMIFVQNLFPDKLSSSIISDYKSNFANNEQNEQLKERISYLLMKFPPILGFANQLQKKQFYDVISSKNGLAICGELHHIIKVSTNEIIFTPKNNYFFSTGTSYLYEGNKETIDQLIKKDIAQTQFGSSIQESLISGLKTFNSIVAKRNRASISIELVAPVLTFLKKP